MLRRQPFIIHVGVSQLNVFIIHGVIKEHLNFYFGVINCGLGLFFYTDSKHQVCLRVRIGRFRGFHFGYTEGRTLRNTTHIVA